MSPAERAALQQHAVGRHAIPLAQDHQVAGHHLAPGDAPLRAVA
jgi:hypothetical protein